MPHTRRTMATIATLTAVISAAGFVTLPNAAEGAVRSGAACTRSQAGKVSSGLVCTRSGNGYRWVLRTTGSTPRATTSAPPPPVTNALPASIDVASIIFGSSPATNGLTLTLTCTGLGGPQRTLSRTLTFGSANSTTTTEFLLGAPTAENPTGSSCNGNVVVKGVTPTSLQVLVNGRPVEGTTSGSTTSIGTFTADAAFTVTLLQYFAPVGPTSQPPTATVPPTPLPSTSSTTVSPNTTPNSSAVTTTSPTTSTTTSSITTPPASSRVPTINVVVTGSAPASVTGYRVQATCTDIVINGSVVGVAQATATVGRNGGPTQLNFLPRDSSTCQLSVTPISTAADSTGTFSVASSGIVRGSGAGQVITTAFPYPTITPITVTITH